VERQRLERQGGGEDREGYRKGGGTNRGGKGREGGKTGRGERQGGGTYTVGALVAVCPSLSMGAHSLQALIVCACMGGRHRPFVLEGGGGGSLVVVALWYWVVVWWS
jgi:hypothetical protein